MHTRPFTTIVALAALLMLTVDHAAAGDAHGVTTHLSLVQAKPDMHSNAANPKEPRDGDSVTFYGTLSEHGKRVGYVALVKTQISNPRDPGARAILKTGEVLRMTTMTFSFGGNDTIVAQGLTVDTLDGMVPRLPEVRAITGGTGKYEFASGEVTSTREPEGTYRHELEFRIRER